MSSSFLALRIGSSAVMSNQTAIEITGHNLANVNTEGYSRQRVAVDQSYTVNGAFGLQGAGVQVQDVYRVHETFLDRQMAKVQSQNTYDQTITMGLDELQSILNESGENSLSASVTEFFNSWESLSINPQDSGLRGHVLETAQSMALQFNQRMQSIKLSEESYSDAISSRIDEVNAYAAEIADLNTKISNSTAGGDSANDLRDRRDIAINRLSELVGVDPEIQGSMVNVRLNDGGPYLVSGTHFFETMTVKNADSVVVGINVETQPVDIKSGEIGAYLELSKTRAPQLRAELSQFMARVTEKVNELQNQGYDADLNPGRNLFLWEGTAEDITIYPSSGFFQVDAPPTIEPGSHYVEVLSVDQASGAPLAQNSLGTLSTGQITLTNSGVYTGDNAINREYYVKVIESNTMGGDMGGMRVQLFRGKEAAGVTYTLASGVDPQNFSWTVDGMTISADITLNGGGTFRKDERSDGLVTTGTVSMDGGPAVSVNHAAQSRYDFIGGTDNNFKGGNSASINFSVYDEFTGAMFTANSPDGRLVVNPDVAGDLGRIVAAAPGTNGGPPAMGDGEMARRIASLANMKIFEYDSETAVGKMANIASNLGEAKRKAQTYETASTTILNQLSAQKNAVSGVNLDEEMVLLLQFQRAFEAAARFVSASDSVIDTIINRLGRVGL